MRYVNEDDVYYARQEMAEERAQTYRYNCGGWGNYSGPCGASDCGSCRNGPAPWEERDDEEDENAVCRTLHVAKVGFPERGIDAGDLYERISGFTYREGGARIGYHTPKKNLLARKPDHPGHNPTKWERLMALREKQLAFRRLRYKLRKNR